MTSPWAWLALVAMATLSRQSAAVQYYTEVTPEDSARGQVEGHDGYGGSGGDDCPKVCRCEWKQFKSSTGLDKPLFTVNCSDQGLLEFPRDLLNNTDVLDLSGNKLQNLTDLPKLNRLQILDVSRNWLRHVDNRWIFEHVTDLKVLSLRDNALKEIQHGSFSGLEQLRELDLSKNVITRVEVHAFTGLDNLQILRLSKNQLYGLQREWFLSLNSLTSLYLDNNLIYDLDNNVLDPLTRLQHLDLSNNSLRMLKREAMAGLGNLKFLDLSGNTRLQEVPGKSLNFLPSLDILLMDKTGVNRLPSLAFSWLKVAEMSLSFMPKLRVVESAAFYNLTFLRTLQLHDNPRLIFIHPHAFLGLSRLKHLLLHNNGLVAIPGQLVTSLPALTDLHLHHNPLHCDCNIYWLRKQLAQVAQHRHSSGSNMQTEPWTGRASSINSSASSSSSSSLVPASSSSSQNSNPPVLSQTNNFTTINGSESPANPTANSINNNSSSSSRSSSTTLTPTIISEPGRVSCFFPSVSDTADGRGSNIPLIQLALQYFPPTCPPSTLPLFPAHINVTLGSELWLECQGLGVPQPRISWILPGGLEVNGTTRIDPHDIPISLKAGMSVGDYEDDYDEPASSTLDEKGDVGLDSETSYGKPRIKSSARIVEETLLHIPSVSLADGGRYGCRAVNELGQDFSSTLVTVLNQPLELTEVEVSDDFITVAWRGSIPRTQIKDFQIYYRATNPPTVTGTTITTVVRLEDTKDNPSASFKSKSQPPSPSSGGSNSKLVAPYIYFTDSDTGLAGLKGAAPPSTSKPSPKVDYKVIYLHGDIHRCTITGLTANTRYEICLVYKRKLTVQCEKYTTARDVRVVATASGGITRISGTQVGVGVGAGVGTVLVLALILLLVTRRMRHRKDYRDPLADDEKSAIPLEGLITPAATVPSTPLTSSRTALLTNSNI